jgi:anaerobic selenocysteine-containing dehydrogenase
MGSRASIRREASDVAVSTICRICTNQCALSVELSDDGRRPVRISADKLNPLFDGYSCLNRLVCRRMMHVYNSSGNVEPMNHGRPYNPAFLNPDDMTALGLVDGSTITLESSTAAIPAIAHADPHLLRGLVSIAFGFGGPPDWDELYRTVGSSVNRLIDDETHYDPISGQPRMSDIPVAVLVSNR